MSVHLDLELSAYLDGELAGAELAAVETHLSGCETCRAALEDLRRIVRRAGSLDDRPPERDLWEGIAARITSDSTADVVPLDSRRRRFSFSVPQLAAAAVTLMALSAGVVGIALRAPAGTPLASTPAAEDARLAPATPVAFASQAAAASYDSAIADLQATLDARRGLLDTSTVRIVEQSLRVIDMAIAQARAALARDPNNFYLNGHLQRTLDQKLHLMRQVATLPVT